jgi:hypothetical protein
MTEPNPIPLEMFGVDSLEELDAQFAQIGLTRVGIYERERETYRAHAIRGPDDGPPGADYIVRRDSDGRYGGYIADLARDGDPRSVGAGEPRYEGYDDRGQYLARAVSLRGILSVFAVPGEHVRWISDRAHGA